MELTQIYQKLNKAELLKDLKPQKQGHRYQLNCPSCHQREAYLYDNGVQIICNRKSNCQHVVTLWDYVQERENLDNKGVYQYFLKAVGEYQDTSRELSAEELRQIQAHIAKQGTKTKTSQAFEQLNQKAIKRLWDDDAVALKARKYLHARGFEDDHIRKFSLGLFLKNSTMLQDFKDTDAAHLLAEPLASYTQNIPRISIPMIGTDGMIKGFTARTCTNTDAQKYLQTKGYERKEFFNAQSCIDANQIWMVEGELDALSAKIRGIESVVAIGTNTVSPEAEALKNLTRYADANPDFVLISDNDEAGGKGLTSLLGVLGKKYDVFIAELPETLNGAKVKDLNDFIVADSSKQPIRDHLNKTIKTESLYSWHIKKVQEQFQDKEQSDALDQAKLKKALYEKYKTFEDKRRKTLFVEYVQDVTQLNKELVQAEFDVLENNETEKVHNEKIREQQTLIAHISPENTEEIKKAHKELGKILSGYERAKDERLFVETSTRALLNKLRHSPEGFETGFEQLDKVCRIPPHAITIIGGRTGGGKTTFLNNLLVNMLSNPKYDQYGFVYLSYEEVQHSIWRKLVSIKSDHLMRPDKPDKNYRSLSRYLIDGQDFNGDKIPAIDSASQFIEEAFASRKLTLLEKSYKIDEIQKIIEEAREVKNGKVILFLDYLQKIPTSGKSNARHLEIQEVSHKILDMGKEYNMPMIMGCQMRRPEGERSKAKAADSEKNTSAEFYKHELRLEGAREAGAIEQDAELFLGVTHGGSFPPLRDPTIFAVSVLKNRNGRAGNAVILKYNPPTMNIKNWPAETEVKEDTSIYDKKQSYYAI